MHLKMSSAICRLFGSASICQTRVWDVYHHNIDVIMTAMASQITGVLIVCSAVCLGSADEIKHESFATLAFAIPHKGLVTRKMFPLDGVIMIPAAVAPTSCADIATQNPNATDGDYWFHHSSGPVRVYCHNMPDNPAAYFSLAKENSSYKDSRQYRINKVAIDVVVSHLWNYL